MAKREKLTQSKFNAIKIMLKAGTEHVEVAEYLDVGAATVYKVSTCESWEEWNQMQKAAYLAALARKEKKEKEQQPESQPEQKAVPEAEKQPQVIEHRQNVTVQTTYYVSQKLDKLCELLTAISSKLAFVVEELTK